MASQLVVLDNVHDVLSVKDGANQSVEVVKKELGAQATNNTIINKNLVDKETKFVCNDINNIVFGSFGQFKDVCNEDSGDHTNITMEESTLIFPTTFVRLELDIEFGSYNHHKKVILNFLVTQVVCRKTRTLIVPDKFVSGELNIQFGTFGRDNKDHNEIKDLEDDEKVSCEVVEDMDCEIRLEVQNYLMKVLKLDQEVSLEKQNKSFSSYKEDIMETRSFGSCGDLAALNYLCSNKAGKFVGQWITDDEYCKAIDTWKTGSCVEEKLSDDINDKKVAKENTRIMITEESAKRIVESDIMDLKEKEDDEIDLKLKEQCLLEETMEVNEAIEKNKRNAEEARIRAEVRDHKEAEQKEMAERFLGQITNDVARNLVPITNEITSIPAVSTLQTQKKVSSYEEKHSDNKQIMKTEESAVRSGIIDNAEEEKVYEISKEEEIEWKEQVAEEARMQAEVQAQKEAKKKERARLKRLRKKEKKRAGVFKCNISDQDVVESNGSNELHNTNEENPQRPSSHFLSKQLKYKTIVSHSTVKLALRKMVLAGTLVLALFILISTN